MLRIRLNSAKGVDEEWLWKPDGPKKLDQNQQLGECLAGPGKDPEGLALGGGSLLGTKSEKQWWMKYIHNTSKKRAA